MLKVVVGYPDRKEEQMIIRQQVQGETLPMIHQVVSTNEIINARKLVRQVYMDEKVEQYILDIVFATRIPEQFGLGRLKPLISYGGSPRASINLALAAKAHAFMNKRGYVIPDDVKAICKDVMRHRVGLTYEAEAENMSAEKIIDEILNVIVVP
jgi:MoxR-like ATPase